MEIYETIAVIVTALATIFGITFWAKGKLIIREIREAFAVLDDALQDDKVTVEELKKVVKEFTDIAKIFLRK